MGKLFWIGSGVGLLAAVGLWGAVTSGISGDVDSLYKKVDARRSELYQWATPGPGPKQRFDDIKNMSHINVEKTYQKGLQDTTAKLHGQMHARNLSLDPKVWEDNPPPMQEVSRFRQWLTVEYNKRNGKLSRAGIALPDETTGLGEVDDWDNVVKEDLPRILRDYRVSCEVFDALAGASAKVHYKAKMMNQSGVMEVHESKELQTKKVIEVGSLRFEGTGTGGRPRPPRRKPGKKKKSTSQFEEHKFTVRFNAHHGVALDFIRRLEESKEGLFVVQTVDVGRVDRLDIGRRSDDGPDPYGNEILLEAPAVVEVTGSLIEFPERKGG